MYSPLIPFLILTGLSEKNILDRQRKIFNDDDYSFLQKRKFESQNPEVLDYFQYIIAGSVINDEKAQKAMMSLSKKYNELLEKEKEKTSSKTMPVAEKSEELYKTMQEQYSKIKKMGFIPCQRPVDNSWRSIEDDPYFDWEGEHKISIWVPTDQNARGYQRIAVRVTKTLNDLDIFTDEQDFENPYRPTLMKALEEHPTIKADLEAKKEEIARLKKNKLSLMFNKQKMQDLKRAKEQYEKLLVIFNKIAKYEQDVNFFENLSTEDKNTFISFLKNIQKLKGFSAEADEISEQINLLNKETHYIDKEKIRNFHAKFIRQAASQLTEEEMLTLVAFEEKTSQNIFSLSYQNEKEVGENGLFTDKGLQINGAVIDFGILNEISNSCSARVNELNEEKEKQHSDEDAKYSE